MRRNLLFFFLLLLSITSCAPRSAYVPIRKEQIVKRAPNRYGDAPNGDASNSHEFAQSSLSSPKVVKKKAAAPQAHKPLVKTQAHKPLAKTQAPKPIAKAAPRPHTQKPLQAPPPPLPPTDPISSTEPMVITATIKKPFLIVLDAGHGGKDTGTLSKKNDYEEKRLTLLTTRIIETYLKQMGYEVVLTRNNDAFISLEGRAHIANKMKADLFVSIHYNHCPNESAEGIEVFYYRDDKNPSAKRPLDSKRLGDTVLSGIVKHTGANPRGVKKANFAVIRETKMPAILIEGGFLSNPSERKKILDLPYRRYLAFGIATGIDKYLSNIKK